MISEIQHFAPDTEIFVCDNGSDDATAEVARAAGATVISETKPGKGFAVRALLSQVEADIYCLIDGDGTYAVRGWERLIGPILKNEADMTVGSRMSVHEKDAFPRFHDVGNRLVSGLVRRLFRTNLCDVLSGYRVMSRGFMTSGELRARGFELESELTIRALQHSYRIAEVPIRYRRRPRGSSSKLRTFKDGALILFEILRMTVSKTVCHGRPMSVASTEGNTCNQIFRSDSR